MNRHYVLISALLIALGFFPAPPLFEEIVTGQSNPFSFNFIAAIVYFAPLVPLLVVLIRWRMQRPKMRAPIALLAFLAAISGTVLTVLISAFSGAGSSIVALQGFALSIAVSASILFLSREKKLSDFKSLPGFLLIIPTAIALWSLGSVPLVVKQANTLSDDNRFCIAIHQPLSSVISSFAQLRGLSFYTTDSGYKIGSKWYFHGLLIVDNSGEKEVYNWSPRQMSFHLLDRPKVFIESPELACSPREKFWNSVKIL